CDRPVWFVSCPASRPPPSVLPSPNLIPAERATDVPVPSLPRYSGSCLNLASLHPSILRAEHAGSIRGKGSPPARRNSATPEHFQASNSRKAHAWFGQGCFQSSGSYDGRSDPRSGERLPECPRAARVEEAPSVETHASGSTSRRDAALTLGT